MRRGEPSALHGYRHGRVPRDVRRRHVVELAQSLFAERGYSAASMDELARRAGVSKPVIYELVGNKEELFRTCMSMAADELAARVSSAVRGVGEPRSAMLAGIEAWFGFVAQRRDVWDGLLSGEDIPASNEVARLRQRQARLVADLMRGDADGTAGAAAGTKAGDDLYSALAHIVNGACESLALWWRDHPEMTPRQLADLCTAVLYPGMAELAGVASGVGPR